MKGLIVKIGVLVGLLGVAGCSFGADGDANQLDAGKASVLEVDGSTVAHNSSTDALNSKEILPLPDELTVTSTGLKETGYTPDTYIPPAYDPFSNKYRPYESFEELIPVAERAANSPPNAGFRMRTASGGLGDPESGTTKTEFTFDAYASLDEETKISNLKVRWDFEGDGIVETFFSKTKTARHTFDKPGTYEVTLEVMDGGGLTGTAVHTVTIVENTAPYAYFNYSPTSATEGRVFTFKTDHSYDSQYENSALEYRFDWDGNGTWDTPYKGKTVWNHRFEDVGSFVVKMEVRDPEGLTDLSEAKVTITKNGPPIALISIEAKHVKQVGGPDKIRYYFDAGSSSDPEGQKLQYRWDYNYTGSDDINFDTYFSYSKLTSGMYEIKGKKTIRLQVRDENGAVSETFASFVAE